MSHVPYRTVKALPLALAVAATSPFSAIQANASALLEEIVVTAQKREQNLQDVPISISAFSGAALKEMGAEKISDLGKATAGVEMNNESVTQPEYNVRGIGTSDFTVGSDPAVALYIDGVYAARGAGAEVPFDDVERVEILKGPQGTLFGRNATGGAIHIITKKPSDFTEGTIGGTVGNYGKKNVNFSFNTPLSETLAFRISGTSSKRDGWLENVNGVDLENVDSESLRTSLLWTPTDKLEVIWRAEYNDLDQNSGTVYTTTESVYDAGNPGEAFDAFGAVSTDAPSVEERDLFGTSVEVNYDFDNFTLTSITAYRSMNVDFLNDEDGSADPNHHFHSANYDEQDQFSQEFRLTGETDKLKWTLGAGYSKEHVDHTTIAEFNYSTLETFALYSGAQDDPSLVGLPADASDQQIAEMINGVRTLNSFGMNPVLNGSNPGQFPVGTNVDGIALSTFLYQTYAGAGALGAIAAIDGCGMSVTSLADYGTNSDAALVCDVLPQLQARMASGGNWVESVRNTGTYESMAVYGDFTYALTEKMNLTAGLRYTYDEKEFTVETGYNPNNYFFSTIPAYGSNPLLLGLAFFNNGVDAMYVPEEFSDDWDALSGRLVLDYFLSDTSMMYASVATGFKSGGFNSLSFGPGIEPSFDQEEVTNYELGYKGEYLDGKVRLNVAAYFYEYENKQDLSLVGSPIPTYNILLKDAEGQGLDMELYWSVANDLFTAGDNLFISTNYSYLDTEVTKDYSADIKGFNEEGEPLAMTPENKFNLMMEYSLPVKDMGELVLRTDYNWTDERVGTNRGEDIDSYEQWNARATFNSASDVWAISAWVNNLTDEEIIGDYAGPATAIGSHTIWRFPPRTYGLDVTYRFQ